MKALHTNHDLLINDGRNQHDKLSGVTKLHSDDIHLRFYSKIVATFKVQDRMKRLEVVMINQTYNPSSSLEAVYKGGFSGIWESCGEIFTMRGFTAMCFMLLMALMMVGNNVCKDILVP